MDIRLNHIQHIGIPVTDLARSITFYTRLGFQNVMDAGFEYNGGTGKVAMLQQGSMMMELYQLPDAELPEIVNRGDGHIDHVAFDVDDIEQTYQELRSNGFDIIENEPVFLAFWKNGCKYFNITGPDGERLEFNQIL